MRAYAELSTCRAIGMQAGPIPVTAVWAWLDRRGVTDPLVVDRACLVLRLVDGLILKKAQAEKPGAHREPKEPRAPRR